MLAFESDWGDSPFDDRLVPLGSVPANQATERTITFPTRAGLSSRLEQMRVKLVQPGQSEQEIATAQVNLVAKEAPIIRAKMSFESTADGEALQPELLAPEAALADVSATILLPKGLQELTMEREWELGTLERGVPQKASFALKRSVSVEELPKLMLRVDANGIGRAFRA